MMCKDLCKVEPTINGPFTPDLATPLSKFASFVKENGWSDELSAGLIGSCTNSSYEDMVIHVWLAYQNAANILIDTRRELGWAGEGRWADDEGLRFPSLVLVGNPDSLPRSPSSVPQGPNRSGQRLSETRLPNCSKKLVPLYWLTHVAHVSDRSEGFSSCIESC